MSEQVGERGGLDDVLADPARLLAADRAELRARIEGPPPLYAGITEVGVDG